ncbi:lysine-specific demethylase 4B-like [Zophobas morio]|uniref:lysine-specific demethylase 4B-like n=1 Tax=Zophobas morio TaxID=2755281 RepID=UPI00308289D6
MSTGDFILTSCAIWAPKVSFLPAYTPFLPKLLKGVAKSEKSDPSSFKLPADVSTKQAKKEILENLQGQFQGIDRIPISRWKLKCIFCQKVALKEKCLSTPNIQCYKKTCYNTFHVTCAQRYAFVVNLRDRFPHFSSFRAYCSHKHNEVKTEFPEEVSMLESMTRVVARYPADGFWYAGVVSEVLTISGFCYVTFPDDERPIITRLSDITCPNNSAKDLEIGDQVYVEYGSTVYNKKLGRFQGLKNFFSYKVLFSDNKRSTLRRADVCTLEEWMYQRPKNAATGSMEVLTASSDRIAPFLSPQRATTYEESRRKGFTRAKKVKLSSDLVPFTWTRAQSGTENTKTSQSPERGSLKVGERPERAGDRAFAEGVSHRESSIDSARAPPPDKGAKQQSKQPFVCANKSCQKTVENNFDLCCSEACAALYGRAMYNKWIQAKKQAQYI